MMDEDDYDPCDLFIYLAGTFLTIKKCSQMDMDITDEFTMSFQVKCDEIYATKKYNYFLYL